jgi:hypothetical protein
MARYSTFTPTGASCPTKTSGAPPRGGWPPRRRWFRPYILRSAMYATGRRAGKILDFHTYCHSVVDWKLPSAVDLEQREGRVHHTIRRCLESHAGLAGRNRMLTQRGLPPPLRPSALAFRAAGGGTPKSPAALRTAGSVGGSRSRSRQDAAAPRLTCALTYHGKLPQQVMVSSKRSAQA